MTAVAQQAIQIIGQKLGLPPAIINMAQEAFAQASGQPGGGVSTIAQAVSSVAEQFNLSPIEAGNLERQSNVILDKFVKDALEGSANGDDGSSAKGKNGKDSFLVAFARAMGKTIDAKMNRMMDISKKIDAETGKANSSNGKKSAVTSELSGELQGVSQEMGLVSNAMSTALKSIGESLSGIARKN